MYLSHKEIAECMHISVDTVKKHIQHALQLIRKNLRAQHIYLPYCNFFLHTL